MYLDDLIPGPDSKKTAEVANKIFGYSLDIDSLTIDKAKKLRESFTNKLSHIEKRMGSNIGNNKIHMQSKMFLEAIEKYILENEVDEDAQRELELYAENNYDLYSRSYVPIAKNLTKKFKKGIYDSGLASKLWKYHADRAAQAYGMEFGKGPKDGLRMFSPNTRRAMAADIEDSWKSEMEAGNFMEDKANVKESVINEGELENAELVLAAKDMVDRIQGMVEDLGEMQNEQLGPLTDAIRDEMGTDVADTFKASMEQVIVGALDGMRQTRDMAEQSSRILQGEAPMDMMGADPEAMPAEEPAMEPTTDMEMDMEQPEEDFAAADAAQAGNEELGRERRV